MRTKKTEEVRVLTLGLLEKTREARECMDAAMDVGTARDEAFGFPEVTAVIEWLMLTQEQPCQ